MSATEESFKEITAKDDYGNAITTHSCNHNFEQLQYSINEYFVQQYDLEYFIIHVQ